MMLKILTLLVGVVLMVIGVGYSFVASYQAGLWAVGAVAGSALVTLVLQEES